MIKKPKDRLIFALDVPDLEQARHYVDLLSGHVGMFKVGLELFTGQGPQVVRMVKDAGQKVFLDLKLFDIPATVERAMGVIAGMGVDLATVHCAGGAAMMEAAARGAGDQVRPIGVTVLTSVGADEIQGSLEDEVLRRARAAQNAGLAGVVCSGREVGRVRGALGGDFLAVCPGIRPPDTAANDQKRVVTPSVAVERGASYIVVGRPIRDAQDPAAAARSIVEDMESVS